MWIQTSQMSRSKVMLPLRFHYKWHLLLAVVPNANGRYFASTTVLELNVNNYIVHHSSGIIIVIGIQYKLFNNYTMSIAKVYGASGITDLSIKQLTGVYTLK